MYFHVNSFYTLEANPDSETRPGPEFTLDQSVCLFFLFFLQVGLAKDDQLKVHGF